MSRMIGPRGIAQGPLSQIGRGGGLKLAHAPTYIDSGSEVGSSGNHDYAIGHTIDPAASVFVQLMVMGQGYVSGSNAYHYTTSYILNSTTVRFVVDSSYPNGCLLAGCLYEFDPSLVKSVQQVSVAANFNTGGGAIQTTDTAINSINTDKAMAFLNLSIFFQAVSGSNMRAGASGIELTSSTNLRMKHHGWNNGWSAKTVYCPVIEFK
jgi:hypothetical protein